MGIAFIHPPLEARLVATLTQQEPYKARTWNLSGLTGISDRTMEMHFGLYEGYVKNANILNAQIAELNAGAKESGADPHFAELTRHLAFEYNGMRLHEYYFDNLTSSANGTPAANVQDAFATSFGSFENWRKNFAAVGTMRGVGWAIAYRDPATGRIINDWVTLHENGAFAGFDPLLVMDVWEHAYLLDYKPAERAKYIEAFFANIDWQAVASRLVTSR
jgi:Fe-Mn family superoxide dismutase